MSKSIDKIDEQIRTLSDKKNNDTDTEKVSQKELLKKAKLKELDEKIEKNKKNTVNKNTERLNNNTIKKYNHKQNLEEKLRSLYESNETDVESDEGTFCDTKVFGKDLKKVTNSVIESENETEKDNLSRVVIILFFIFMILVVFYIIFFIALSFA